MVESARLAESRGTLESADDAVPDGGVVSPGGSQRSRVGGEPVGLSSGQFHAPGAGDPAPDVEVLAEIAGLRLSPRQLVDLAMWYEISGSAAEDRQMYEGVTAHLGDLLPVLTEEEATSLLSSIATCGQALDRGDLAAFEAAVAEIRTFVSRMPTKKPLRLKTILERGQGPATEAGGGGQADGEG